MIPVNAETWKLVTMGAAVCACAAAIWGAVGSERAPVRVRFWRYVDGLDRRLRRLHQPRVGARIAFGQVIGVFFVVALTFLLRTPLLLPVAALIAVAPYASLELRLKQRVATLDHQADGFCLALANALKATPSIGAAFETTTGLMSGPVQEEMSLANKETKLGLPINDAIRAAGARAGSVKLGAVLAAVLIGRQVGGNLTRVLETTAGTLRELERLEGVVRQKTADGRMQLWGLSLVPPIIVFCIHRLDNQFFEPLMTTFVGRLCLGAALVMYVVGVAAARKVLVVDV